VTVVLATFWLVASDAFHSSMSVIHNEERLGTSMKKGPKIALTVALVVIVAAAAVLIYLVYPGTPSRSRFMTFQGFIELPQTGRLNVLDYLTLRDHILFVTAESSGKVFKATLDPSTQTTATSISTLPGGGAVHGVVLMPSQNVAFVTRGEENTVDVFDPASLQQIARIPVADDADAILYDPSSKLVYVANGDAKMATLIDPDKRTTVATIALEAKPEYPALDAHTGLLYQNLQDTSMVAAINLAQRSIVGKWPLAPCEGPSGMAIDSEQRRLFAVCSHNATLVVFDLERHEVITSLKIGGGPDSVAYDATLHRIYAAGKSGKLDVIQQDGPNIYRVLDQISTHYGAHTLVVDPASHQVFVGYASLFNHPRIAVFSPATPGP
jgi:DNA-binding beta-propeller fold protein YncE